MKVNNIGGLKSIDEYVKTKLDRFNAAPHSFETLYSFMFSERGNVLYEKSEGYRIIKTTYGESADNIERKAKTLCTLLSDCEKQSAVGLYADNGIEWIEAFWAIVRAGFCPLLLNIRTGKENCENALRKLGAAAVISDSTEFEVKTVPLCALVPAEEKCENTVFGDEMYLCSSGTSDNIKLCAYSAEELFLQINDSFRIITECKQIKKHYEGELKLLTFLPFYHIFGFVAVYIWFAFFSRTLVNLNDFTPNTVLNTVRRHKVTHIFAVPLFWNKVYEAALNEINSRGEKTVKKFEHGLKLSLKLSGAVGALFRKAAFGEVREGMFGESICFCISGGSEIKPEVLSFFNGIGYRLANGYGMTETGITSVELSSDIKKLCSASVGKPLSSVEYRINENGVLEVRGGSTAKRISDRDGIREKGEWFVTGDLASERGGSFFIHGRTDDLVVSAAGENLNPGLLEPAFEKIRGVGEACLISAENKPVLLVSVSRTTDENAFADIKAAVQKTAGELKIDTFLSGVFYTRSPLTDASEIKKNRRVIREKYLKNGYTEMRTGTRGEIGGAAARTVAEVFAGVLNIDESAITADFDFFTDGGGTSLDYFAAFAVLSEKTGIPLNPADMDNATTVSAIAEYIEGKTQ